MLQQRVLRGCCTAQAGRCDSPPSATPAASTLILHLYPTVSTHRNGPAFLAAVETLWCKACKSILSLAYKPNLDANGKISVKHLDQTIVQPRMTKCCFRFTGSRILASLNWVPSHLCSAVKPCQTARSLIHFNCSSWNCGTARVWLDALTLGRSRAQSSIGYGLFVVHACVTDVTVTNRWHLLLWCPLCMKFSSPKIVQHYLRFLCLSIHGTMGAYVWLSMCFE